MNTMAIDARQWQGMTNAIGIALVDAAPERWRRLDLQWRADAVSLDVLRNDGSSFAADIPGEARDGLLRLRQAMHDPEEGTWLSCRVIIDAPGTIYVKYNFDWAPPPNAGHIAEPRITGEPFGAGEQDRVCSSISNLVTNFCPIDWSQVMITYRAIGDHTELSAMVRRATDGGLERWTPRPELAALLAELRAGMYRPGRGTWNETSAHVHLDSRIESTYTWDQEPAWDGVPPTSAFVRELAGFRRDPGMVPEWMAERAGRAAVATFAAESDSAAAVKETLVAAGEAAVRLELDPARHRIGEVADGAWCLVPQDGRWSVFWAQGEQQLDRADFATARDAGRYFVGHLYLNQAAFRDELPPDAKRPTAAWPIQPLGDDGGLSLYQGKRIVTLPPGTEMDRYGDPSGNTLFAARTEFTHRSHKAEREQREYHIYRLTRSVRAITGTAVAWYDQAGGGTAYVLERSVADLLTDGSLVAIPQATTHPPRP